MAIKTNNNLIVIAEDSPTQAERLRYILEEAGYKVLHGKNGKEAFSLVKKTPPVLLISDIVMPVMDGYELCKKIKTDTNLENIPVMLLTTLSDPSDIIKGLESKADNFITKPYNDKNLLSRVRNIIINRELRKDQRTEMGPEILFAGKKHRITSDRLQIFDLLMSLFENFRQKNIELNETNNKLVATQEELEYLNMNLEKEVETRTKKITRLNSLLKTIRDINQLIVKEKDPVRLLQIACANLVKVRNYSQAWIMKLDEKGKVAFAVHYGLGNEFQALEKDLKNGRWPVCCQKAMKQSEIVITKSLQTECNDCPLVKAKYDMGSLAIQIRHGNRTYGILVINIPSKYLIIEEEHNLLYEVAGDLGFALSDIELIEEHKKANIELQKRTHDLNERVKDLNCLYSIDEITIVPGITFEEVFRETVDITRKSWEYPGITGVKITHGKDGYKTGNFEKTKWMLKTDLVVDDKITGKIEVCYLEKKPDHGPFLEEEIHLLQRIANSLVNYIKRQETKKELVKAKEKAEESDRLKSSFLSNMSHEIRTPLNAIVGFSDMLGNDDIDDEEKVRFVPIIQENTNQLLHLIDDILDLSKMESDQLKIFKKECRVDKVLKYMVDVFNNQKTKIGREIDIRLKTEKQIEGLTINTDTVRLQQVLTNLIGNALKFTVLGYIEIGCTVQTKKDGKNDGFIQFWVKDTGIGISEKEQKIIFDRFTKIEDDKTKLYRGTGLGLAISKKLVNMLGGEMWVESSPDKGSTFYFTIPADEVEKPETKTKPSKKVQDTVGSYNWSDKSILVAEDEESNFKLIEVILQRTKIKITHVINGEEAVEACKSNSFDLVLMDIKMPKMDGVTATKMIKNIRKDLPVIAVTAYAREEEKEELYLAGCNDIVVKPVNMEELFTIIRKYLNKTR